ncbi:uncharacterized serine-rich protein C215.13-like [Haliotis rubra]|uniref:uncharacterized serine-rich protein C215.13-like n=1 Tax=Haliotis rubra TaxID=36100 RepID=UPI001EE61C22|nr:uncharacterized serine-rich protein C215.13-like [Haliotis rubra]
MDVWFNIGIRIVILLILPNSYLTQENICPTSAGEKVVHVCESSFASGTSIYLDTIKAVDYQGSCTCTLRAQGGAVDFQLSVQGVHTDCDATLYVPPPIDHTYNCVDKTPSTTTGRIGSGQILFISLTKNSDVADFCVHLVQTSTGSLNVACSTGTFETTTSPTTTSSTSNGNSNVVTTSDTSVTVSEGPSTTSPENIVNESTGSSTASPDNTVTESKDASSESPDNTVTESKDQSPASPDDTATESKDASSESPDNSVTESKDQSPASPDDTATESKDASSESPDNTVTESKVSSGENQNITSSGRTGANNADTPQSVIVVSFVVVGVFAAAVVVIILFGLFTYCRALINKTAVYSADVVQKYPPTKCLRSSDECMVRTVVTLAKTFGSRSFQAAGPIEWTSS